MTQGTYCCKKFNFRNKVELKKNINSSRRLEAVHNRQKDNFSKDAVFKSNCLESSRLFFGKQTDYYLFWLKEYLNYMATKCLNLKQTEQSNIESYFTQCRVTNDKKKKYLERHNKQKLNIF